MAVNYTYRFKKRVAPMRAGFPNVLVGILWQVYAVDDADGLSAWTSGEVDMPEPTAQNYKPLNEITQANLQTYLANRLNVPAIRAGLVARIAEQREPETYIVD